ncbi:MAG: tryptophan--tRNA ligase [Planctomycetota bacterium]|jgi:tryptophanyl-tRNA synthetase
MTEKKGVIFSGIQPSGMIHMGNYLGAIKNWVSLLDEYDGIFCVVDYHAITQPYETKVMQDRIFDAARVNIAAGLDPARCTLFIQSHVPEHTELCWILDCITPVGDLGRMTQYKEKSKQHHSSVNMGLLNYPVLQAADILLYKAVGVPVAEDQAQHLELSREIARRFNRRFGDTFPEPDTMFSQTLKVLGTDGKHKMSKSMDNYLGLLEPEDVLWEKLRTSVTDEDRKRRSDPGNPDVCNIFTMHLGLSPEETVDRVNRECRTAGIGCVDCKKFFFEHMMEVIRPIKEKADELSRIPERVEEALKAGAARCKTLAEKTMDEVRGKIALR